MLAIMIGTAIGALSRPVLAGRSASAAASEHELVARVEVALGEADDATFAAALRDALVERLRGHEIAAADDAPTTLLVVVGWAGESRSDLELRYFLTTKDGDPQRIHRSVCAACGSREAIAHLATDLEPLWFALEDASVIHRPVAAPAPTIAPPPASPRPETRRSRPRRSIGPLGLAGAGVGAMGLAALTGGAVLCGVRYAYPEGSQGDTRRELLPPGIALAAVGGAATIAGIAMMAVDLTRKKASHRIQAKAAVTPRGLGVALRIRW